MEFVNAKKVYRKSGGAQRSLSLHQPPSQASLTLCPNHESLGGMPQPFTRNPKSTTNPHQRHIHESKSPWILSYAIANYDL
jgi:hypothetical protein